MDTLIIIPLVYLIPAAIAFSLACYIRRRAAWPAVGLNYAKILFYLCLAEGGHNGYFFVATLLRNFSEEAYDVMTLPLPWLLAQGIIAVTFLSLGIFAFRNRQVEIGDVRAAEEAAEKFRELAYIDPLTKLNNRRLLDDALEREKARSQRVYRPFSLMMLDLDGFKQFNDSFGHQAGDQMLTQVAGCITTNLRSEMDTPFRYGGDEFFIIFPETTISEAAAIGDRLNALVKSVSRGRITFSIGLIEISPDCRMTPFEMIKLADVVMYRAKKDGGDRVFSVSA